MWSLQDLRWMRPSWRTGGTVEVPLPLHQAATASGTPHGKPVPGQLVIQHGQLGLSLVFPPFDVWGRPGTGKYTTPHIKLRRARRSVLGTGVAGKLKRDPAVRACIQCPPDGHPPPQAQVFHGQRRSTLTQPAAACYHRYVVPGGASELKGQAIDGYDRGCSTQSSLWRRRQAVMDMTGGVVHSHDRNNCPGSRHC